VSKEDVSLGQFNILASYTYTEALRDGLTEDEAKERGMAAAIMGAQARLGVHHRHEDDFPARKDGDNELPPSHPRHWSVSRPSDQVSSSQSKLAIGNCLFSPEPRHPARRPGLTTKSELDHDAVAPRNRTKAGWTANS
jgi:hypothetical protein